MKPSTSTNPRYYPVETPDGIFWAGYSAAGLAGLHFPGDHDREESEQPPPRWHDQTVRALRAVLAGGDPARLPPLDLAGHTAFRRAVWQKLLTIRAGTTLSYGAIAASLGQPLAARAVGGACGANPIPVLIPCHRVLGAAGALGGFSCGLSWKRRLLEREGVDLAGLS